MIENINIRHLIPACQTIVNPIPLAVRRHVCMQVNVHTIFEDTNEPDDIDSGRVTCVHALASTRTYHLEDTNEPDDIDGGKVFED